MRLFLFLLIAAVIAVVGCSSKTATITDLGPAEFSELIADERVFVVDVHIPEQEHIKGTNALIPYNALEENREKLPSDKNTPIAVYCRSGSMSEEAAQTLKAMGYRNIYDLLGGTNAWELEGMEFGEIEVKAETNKATVFKSLSCGCCTNYVAELKRQGFEVETRNMNDLSSIKSRYSIPRTMESCHTTVIGDYFIEGHVPFEAVNKLLQEKPAVDGIALPGMPDGSPGMVGQKRGAFIVYSLSDGKYSEFMRV